MSEPISPRERALLGAAEEVLARWVIVRISGGSPGSWGLSQALKKLDIACEGYKAEECVSDD